MKMRFVAITLLPLIFTSVMAWADDQPVVKMHSIRLYNPESKLTERIGTDAGPMSDYIKLLDQKTGDFLRGQNKPEAKGLLVAVGVKPGGAVRVWCQAVDGEIPRKTLDDLEKELEKVTPMDVKNGPVAFAIEFNIGDREPKECPTVPKAWSDGLKDHPGGVEIPDGLFPIIWPDNNAATKPGN